MMAAMADGRNYSEVLAEAQAQGYAEADPTADVEGYDVVAKALILSALVFGHTLSPDQVARHGITGISKEQIHHAARDGKYRSMTRWYKTNDGDLAGDLELPLAVGTVGGVVSVHPMTKLAIKILGVKTAKELAAVLVAVGLAQNFAAMKALVSEGIQAGHMRLHARNIAMLAGARGNLIKLVAQRIADERNVNVRRAKEIIALMTEEDLNNNTYNNNK